MNFRRDLFLVGVNILMALPGHAFRRFVFVRVANNSIGRGSSIERGCRLTGRGGVRVGSGTNINGRCTLDGRGGLTIGNLVNVSSEVVITTADHDPQSPRFSSRARPVVVRDRSWVSTRSMLLPGAAIGEGAVIAAGAVVAGDVAPWTIVGGVPARTLGARSTAAQTSLDKYRRWFQ